MNPEDLHPTLEAVYQILRLIPHLIRALKELTPLIKSTLHRLRKKP